MHDPVCGMRVGKHALTISGYPYGFCSEHCRRLFLASPDRFGAQAAEIEAGEGGDQGEGNRGAAAGRG